MKYRDVLFDLDGTLTDSAPGITNGVRRALEHLGVELEEERLTEFIGPPLKDAFRSICGFDERTTALAVLKYREYYTTRGIFENRPYEGVPEMLSRLREQGARLILATSKPTIFAERILERFGLDPYFSFVGGAELNGPRSAKTDVLRFVLESTGIRPGGPAIMIGDRRHDILGARAVGLDSLGVTYGYGGRAELERAGATFIVNSVAELEALLDG